MIALIKLFFAHLIGDFLLQPKSWVEEKQKKKSASLKFYLHLLLHGLLIMLVFWDITLWPLALSLMALHGVIDLLKLYAQKEHTTARWFLADQLLHVAAIVGLWYLYFNPGINVSQYMAQPTLWIYATAVLFITTVSGIVINQLLSGWSGSLRLVNDESLHQAGKYIGILERLFIFTFVVMGKWEGIGFLLAAKSIFRFSDLKESKDRKLTEYILIGTLLSFAIAIATGLIVTQLVE